MYFHFAFAFLQILNAVDQMEFLQCFGSCSWLNLCSHFLPLVALLFYLLMFWKKTCIIIFLTSRTVHPFKVLQSWNIRFFYSSTISNYFSFNNSFFLFFYSSAFLFFKNTYKNQIDGVEPITLIVDRLCGIYDFTFSRSSRLQVYSVKFSVQSDNRKVMNRNNELLYVHSLI